MAWWLSSGWNGQHTVTHTFKNEQDPVLCSFSDQCDELVYQAHITFPSNLHHQPVSVRLLFLAFPFISVQPPRANPVPSEKDYVQETDK